MVNRTWKLGITAVLFSVSLRMGLYDVVNEAEVSLFDAATMALVWMSGVFV